MNGSETKIALHADAAAPAYRPDIDGLRAVAVLAVVAFHAFPDLARGGFVGVDIFFVISGYLISSIILNGLTRGTFTFAGFYARRIRRIFPALVLVLTACWAWAWFAVFSDQYAQLGKHIAGGAGFASNVVLWNESGYFDDAARTKPLLHLWSLGIEEQFYLAWPLLLSLAWRWRRRHVLTLIMAVAASSFLFNVRTTRIDAVAAFYSPFTRVWELAMGAALASLTVGAPANGVAAGLARVLAAIRTRWPDLAAAAGLAAIVAAVTMFERTTSFPGWRAALPTAGAFLLIAAGSDAWINRRVLARPALVGIGLVSYPLYLWHWPLLTFASLTEPWTTSLGTRVLIVALSGCLAWLTYILWEKPIRFGRRGRAAVIALSVLMSAAFGVGMATYRADGFPDRPVNTSDVAHFLQYYERLHKSGLEEAYRRECDFMDWKTEQTRTAISADCTAPGPRGTWLLWGDSYAQALSLGVRQVLPAGVALAQVTTSGCPPRRSEPDPLALGGRCETANQYARQAIGTLKPEIVILAQMLEHRETDWIALAEAIRQMGGKRVILVGPIPQWSPSLPLLIANRYWGQPHERLKEAPGQGLLNVDRALKAALEGSPLLQYVSLVDALCNADGCLTSLPGDDRQLIAVDSGHLSPRGSVFVVDLALRRVLVGP